MTVPIVAV